MNWLQQLVSRPHEYSNVSEEIAEHLQEKIDELISGGMPRQEAEAAARRQFGNALLLEEHSREVWQWAVFDSVLRDLKYSFRQLRRNPGFTFTVLLTLSVAIGANTAVFSMVNALLLRPLPYPQPERLGSLVSHYEGISNSTGKATSEDDNSSDGETWELVRDNVSAVIAGATAGTRGVNLQIGSSIRYVREQRVSAGYLEALGVRPIFGRSFTKEEDRPGGAKVVVVSYEIWQSLLGADREAIGKAIHLKGEPYTVVGVLPPHTETPDRADLLTPLRPTRTGEGGGNNYGVILRLRDGASWAQADAQLAPLHPEILQRRPTRAHAWLYAVPLQKDFARDQGTPVYLLMSAVALVLLIACANLAGLMLVRVLRRRGEIATRLALGATPASVLRQLMTEPLVLALVGGSIGVAMAANGLGLLARLAPPDSIPVGGLGLDHRVLWFAVAISLFSSLFIGILPALELRRMDLRSSITANASRSSSAAARSRMRQALIAGEVMLTVVLLAGAGLLIRTLVYLETLPPGFDATNVLTAQASLDDARYHDPVAFHKLLQQSVDAMKRIPGVESAAVGLSLPYERGLNNGVVILDGPSAGKEYTSSDAYVTPEYFQSMRIPILSGRGFAESDSASSETVALVNFTFARKLLGSNDPVGRHIRSNGVTYTIVGMVADVTKRPGIIQTAPLATEAVFYVPATQMSQSMVNIAHIWLQPSWIVRTNGPVAGLPEAMQKALSDCDPSLPFVGFHSLSDIQSLALQQQRFEVLLLGILAGLALLLSLVGVYGLVSNMVVQRTREIGVRMALGSSVRQAMVEVGTSGIVAVGAGMIAGLALAVVAVRLIKSELYGVKIYDPLTFTAVLLLLIIAATAATFLPTRRIARIDPASTLRAE
ncbi:MAG TPA: ABC transporter permease [Candidatus Angelobacter sp.]|nr:ABC transporter permease [Candidatus Angelobacter sp.]